MTLRREILIRVREFDDTPNSNESGEHCVVDSELAATALLAARLDGPNRPGLARSSLRSAVRMRRALAAYPRRLTNGGGK